MKLKQSFVPVLVIILLNLVSGKEKGSVVPYAINAIIEKHFVNLETYPGKVDFTFIGNNDLEFSKYMDKLLKIKSANTKVQISTIGLHEDFDNGGTYELGDSGIVIFDSVKRFVENASALFWVSNERHRSHHLVYVPRLKTSDIINTFVDGFDTDHVDFLMHEADNSIELVTTYMFTPQACQKVQLKTINRFDLQTLEWENSIFYPKKYENFYGCELQVAYEKHNLLSVPLYNLMKMTFK